MDLVSIGLGKTGDVYFVTTDAVASILQSMFSCWNFDTVDVLKYDARMMIWFHCSNVVAEG